MFLILALALVVAAVVIIKEACGGGVAKANITQYRRFLTSLEFNNYATHCLFFVIMNRSSGIHGSRRIDSDGTANYQP
jgi:hypothetical protein